MFYPQSKYILHVRSQCCSAIGWRCFILGSIARKCRWNVHLVLVTFSNQNRTQLYVRSQPVVCGYNHTWLVVWNMKFMTFHILGMSSSQLTFIFFRGVETTNQILIFGRTVIPVQRINFLGGHLFVLGRLGENQGAHGNERVYLIIIDNV